MAAQALPEFLPPPPPPPLPEQPHPPHLAGSMKRRLSRWLESLALPLFLFPFLHDCRFSDDRGWERGRRLSEEHGCGAMPSLDGLPAAFDAFMQVRQAGVGVWMARGAAGATAQAQAPAERSAGQHPPRPVTHHAAAAALAADAGAACKAGAQRRDAPGLGNTLVLQQVQCGNQLEFAGTHGGLLCLQVGAGGRARLCPWRGLAAGSALRSACACMLTALPGPSCLVPTPAHRFLYLVTFDQVSAMVAMVGDGWRWLLKSNQAGCDVE